MAEPWRNGVVEKFNDQYQQRFLDKVEMATELDLTTESLNFELRHNSSYRYSKLGGKTPLKALEAGQAKLRFPDSEHAPQHRLKNPVTGRYHSSALFEGIAISMSSVSSSAYRQNCSMSTWCLRIDVKGQILKLFLDKTQVEQFNYRLR
jgi:putative transposase